jgi:hypothetical protein
MSNRDELMSVWRKLRKEQKRLEMQRWQVTKKILNIEKKIKKIDDNERNAGKLYD